MMVFSYYPYLLLHTKMRTCRMTDVTVTTIIDRNRITTTPITTINASVRPTPLLRDRLM